MDKALWGKRVTDKLHIGERNIDTAIRSLTDLLNELQDAQDDLGVSPVSSNPTISKVMDTLMSLQEARTNLTAGHHRLEKLGKAMQIRPSMTAPAKPVTPSIDDDAEDSVEHRVAAR